MNTYKKNKVGEVHESNNYGKVEIINQHSCNSMTIKFLEDGTIIENQKYGRIKRGEVKNPCKKEYYGIGYMGIGEHNNITSPSASKRWQNMMQRCYDEIYHRRYPTYKTVEICTEWHNFQNFADWYIKNYNPETMQGWCLDKDLLTDNKFYSPATCCFLPQKINTLLTNIHKNISVRIASNKYYSKVMVDGVNKWSRPCKTKEEALNIAVETRRVHSQDTLNKYKTYLKTNVVKAIQILIDDINKKVTYANM